MDGGRFIEPEIIGIIKKRSGICKGVGYSLQIDASPLLRKYIAAAIYKYKEDNDFEDILENMDIEDFSDEKSYSQYEMVRHVIVDCAVRNTKIIDEYLKSSKVQKSNKDLFFVALGRLSTSFKAATLLLNNGFFVEVCIHFTINYRTISMGKFFIGRRGRREN